MKKQGLDYLITAIGILLLGTGFFLLKTLLDPQGVMRALPYICIGIGCGAFGHGVGNIVTRKVMKKNPDIQKQLDIEKEDERNIAIANLAKAKAFDMMIYVFGALMIAFALMGVDMVAILLLVFAYLLVIGYNIYYLFRYNKEM